MLTRLIIQKSPIFLNNSIICVSRVVESSMSNFQERRCGNNRRQPNGPDRRSGKDRRGNTGSDLELIEQDRFKAWLKENKDS